MTIEQEFFEAFGIEPEFPYDLCKISNLNNEDSCNYCCNLYFDNCKTKKVRYPEITSEIVLELIEILNREYNILIIECMANSTKITACPAPEQDWGCDEAYYRVYVEEKDLRTAILKVCSDYNVVVSIQDQVRQLFK